MSYQALYQLIGDGDFNGRTQAAGFQQAEVFKDDARAEYVALSSAVLRGELDKLAA